MASLLPLIADPIPLTWNEALSGISGSISLAAWIFLLLPQLLENYRQHSADGISLTFLLIWFLGDVTNLAGAIWADLVPTVIALAIYFCFADFVLIGQCVYYNTLNRRREAEDAKRVNSTSNGSAVAVEDEHAPLLPPTSPSKSQRRRLTDVTEENLGLPGSRRRSTRRPSSPEAHRRTSLDALLAEPDARSTYIKNTLSVLAIFIVGAAGWAIAWRTGAWRPTPVDKEVGAGRGPWGAEVLGYASAVAYLGARVPQIVKNQRERSCEGLSLLFFLLSVLGNATYGAGILFHSLEKEYFLTNLPWLIGSLGTIAEDVVIFAQFRMFGEKVTSEALE